MTEQEMKKSNMKMIKAMARQQILANRKKKNLADYKEIVFN